MGQTVPQLPARQDIMPDDRPEERPVDKNAVIIFSAAGKYGLKRNDSVILAPVYQEIQTINKSTYWLKNNERYGLADKNAKIIMPVEWDMIKTNFMINQALTVFKNGKAGVYNIKGEEIVPAIYDTILYANVTSNYSFALMNNEPVLLYKNIPVRDQYASIAFYNNLVIVKQNEKYGVLKEGAVIVPPQYDSIFVANQKSYMPFKPGKYFSAYSIDGSMLFIIQNKKYGLLDDDGTVVITPENDRIDFDSYRKLFYIRKDSLTGLYIERTGRRTAVEFQEVYTAGVQYITVKKDGKYGILTYNNEQVIPCEYEKIESMPQNAGFRVWQNGKAGWLSVNGRPIIPAIYDNIEPFPHIQSFNGLYKVFVKDKMGIADPQNKMILPPVYTDIGEIANLLEVFNGRKFGLYKKDGTQIFDTVYIRLRKSITNNSHAVFSYKDSLTGIIKDDGTVLFNPVFKEIHYITNTEGLVSRFNNNQSKYLVVKDTKNRYGIFDEDKMQMTVPVLYDNIYQKFETKDITYFTAKKSTRFGIIDGNNNIIIPFVYDSVDMSKADADILDEPQFVAKKGNRYGAITLKNKTSVPFVYSSLVKLSGDNAYKASTGKYYILINGKNTVMNKGPFDDIAMFEGNSALSFYNGKMKLLTKGGAFISKETPMEPHIGYTTFEELKQALIKALNSTDNTALKIFAGKVAPSYHILYFLKQNIFTRTSIGYVSVEGIREKYYEDLVAFKTTQWQTGRYNKSALTDVDDYTFSDDGFVTNNRIDEPAFGGAVVLEKLLKSAVKINGYWISSYFMAGDFYVEED